MSQHQQGVIVEANLLPVRILRCARAALWPWWRLRGCRASGWLVYANDIDGASIVSGTRRTPLRAGRTIAIPPGIEFQTSPGPDTHQLYAEFDIPGMPSGLPREPTDLGEDPTLTALSRELHGTLVLGSYLCDPSLLNLAHAWIRLSLARLMLRLPVEARKAWSHQRDDPLQEAVDLIERDLGGALYVAALAERCNMGPQWFTRLFRARFGKSPAQYVLDRRVSVAAQRLVHEDSGVDAVAESCGFTDRAHFTKAFAKRMGQPPGRYREEERRRFRGG